MTQQQQNMRTFRGSLDGEGAGDHDQPYQFGRRPRMTKPYPFNTRQYARLLVYRSRLQDHVTDDGEPEGHEVASGAA